MVKVKRLDALSYESKWLIITNTKDRYYDSSGLKVFVVVTHI